MKQTVIALLTSLALVFAPVSGVLGSRTVHAQATVNSTTLSAAMTATQQTMVVASASTIAAGQLAFLNGEMVYIQSISGTTATVTRGYNSTRAAAHAAGVAVWTGPANYFAAGDPVGGVCTSTDEVALPRIVPASGSIYQCSDSTWVKYRGNGFHTFSAGASTSYTSAGAITVKPGLSLIGSGGALAMTLAAPSVTQDGMIMAIFASTAQAHTITNTAGFNGGTTARDVCTLGGAIGDGIVVQAWGGVWYVLANRNCTLA